MILNQFFITFILGRNMYDHHYKLIIVGDSNVGKTALITKFINKTFDYDYQLTIGVEVGTKVILLNDKKIKLQIWDTAGQEKFRALTKSYYKNAHGVILCYSITDLDSYYNVTEWLSVIYDLLDDDTPIILVGTKSDLKSLRQISTEIAENYANKKKLLFAEVSSKTGRSVDECFIALTMKIYESNKRSLIMNNILNTDKRVCCYLK